MIASVMFGLAEIELEPVPETSVLHAPLALDGDRFRQDLHGRDVESMIRDLVDQAIKPDDLIADFEQALEAV